MNVTSCRESQRTRKGKQKREADEETGGESEEAGRNEAVKSTRAKPSFLYGRERPTERRDQVTPPSSTPHVEGKRVDTFTEKKKTRMEGSHRKRYCRGGSGCISRSAHRPRHRPGGQWTSRLQALLPSCDPEVDMAWPARLPGACSCHFHRDPASEWQPANERRLPRRSRRGVATAFR